MTSPQRIPWRGALVIAALTLTAGQAVSASRLTPSLPPRTGHAMATAGPDGGVFAIGGATTAGDTAWQFDGAAWRAVGVGGPANRNMLAAAYDTRRRVLVVFGGVGMRNGSRYGETWEWNGSVWQERDVRGPGARDHHAMAYDEARGVVVMYGGMNGDHKGLQSDTWTWDGTTWTRAEESSGPGGIGHHAMAYDARRQRVVMFGGITDSGPATSDVWEWGGTTWLRIAAPGPGIRSHMKMAYDAARGVVVMFGGGVPGAGPTGIPPTDTWTWDGTTWMRVATEGPMPRYLHAMAYDAKRQRVVLTAGNRSARPYDVLNDTWEWNGTTWSEAGAPPPAPAAPWPAARHGHTMTFHERLGMTMMFGDADDKLWGWNGREWTAFDGPGPGALKHMRLAYDAARDRLVLFGGAAREASGDTWEWDERGWTKVTSTGPGPRMGYAMAYDPSRQRVVLVGGLTGSRQWATDTWEWDGRVWTKRADTGPSARLEAVMVFDPASRRLLYGGGAPTTDPAGTVPDMWAWDGQRWESWPAAPGLRWPQLTADPLTGAPLLFGGQRDTDREASMYLWQDRAWRAVTPAVYVTARQLPGAAFDTRRKRVVTFGGSDPVTHTPTGDLWEWDGRTWRQMTPPPASR